MKKKQWILGLVVLLALVALFLWARGHNPSRGHNPFSFSDFGAQLARAEWPRILIAFGCIFTAYFCRAIRWAALMRHNKKVPGLSLVGPQVMGFTAVALIGRVADPVRPYLIARKTDTELSSQIAVYVVERFADICGIALFFSLAILFQSDRVSEAVDHFKLLAFLSHHGARPAAIFLLRFGGLIFTALGILFLIGIRLGGEIIARVFESAFGIVSKNLGRAAGDRIRTFHAGLDTIRSFADFSVLAVLSLFHWTLISAAYFQTMRAFTGSPQLAGITVSNAIILMVLSGAASVVQLPVLGWFSQIGVVAAAITGFFGAALEASTACAAALLLVTFVGVVPFGLVWAQFENVSLRRVTVESEHAGEELAAGSQPLP